MSFKIKNFLIIGLPIILAGLFFLASVSVASAAGQGDSAKTYGLSFFRPILQEAEKVAEDFGIDIASATAPDPDYCGTTAMGAMDSVGCSGATPIATISWPSAYPNMDPTNHYAVNISGIGNINVGNVTSYTVSSGLNANTTYSWSVEAYKDASNSWPSSAYGYGGRPNGSFTTGACCTPSCGGCSVSCGGGTQTCTNADCSTYPQPCSTQCCPVNGGCGLTNTCTSGTFSDTADGDCTNNWNCTGSCGGSTASCFTNKSDGTACTSDSNSCTNDTCSAGTCSHPAIGGTHKACSGTTCQSGVANTPTMCTDGCVDNITCGGCITATFNNVVSGIYNSAGTAKIPTINANQSYMIKCDFGAAGTPNIPNNNSGCSFSSYSGTTALFNCTAPSTAQTLPRSCVLNNAAPDYYCSQNQSIGNLTVNAPTCPVGQVNLSLPAITVGQTSVASAPAGFTGGSFQSSNTSYATVSGTTVTGVAVGSANITGANWTYTSTGTTGCALSARAITVTAAPVPTVTLNVNGSHAPSSVTAPANLTVSWTTTNSGLLSICSGAGQGWTGAKAITGGNDSGGNLNGITVGTYTYSITCNRTAGGTITDSVNITVNAGSCPAGQVNLSLTAINVGQTSVASAPAGFTGGTFSSSNTSVATITGGTTVKGIAAGSSNITGTNWTYSSNGATGCALSARALTVTAVPRPHIVLNPTAFTFTGQSGGATPAGQTLRISNTGNATLNWTSSLSRGWCHLSATSGSLAAGNNQNITVTVDAPSNIGSFTCAITVSDANADNSPQTNTLTYTVTAGSCPAGTVNLFFTSINVGQTSAASAPAGFTGGTFSSSNTSVATITGGTTVKGIAAGSSNITGTNWTYSSNGATGCALSGRALTVTSAPPTAINLSYTPSNYCISPPQGVFNWTFSDAGDSQSAYQVQIDDEPNFLAPRVTDSGKIFNSGGSFRPLGTFPYNRTYYWRLMVWDSYGVASNWISPSTVNPAPDPLLPATTIPFRTPLHQFPTVPDIYWAPVTPSANENVVFGAATVCYNTGGSQVACPVAGYHWTFNNANPSVADGVAAPQVQFLSSGASNASLRITDNQGYGATCAAQRSEGVTVQLPLPGWKEISP